jgi:hypothetical protein
MILARLSSNRFFDFRSLFEYDLSFVNYILLTVVSTGVSTTWLAAVSVMREICQLVIVKIRPRSSVSVRGIMHAHS